MTKTISSVTQAVLDASAQAMECSDGFLPYEQELMATVLRAAAQQLREAYASEESVDFADDWLDSMADELERICNSGVN